MIAEAAFGFRRVHTQSEIVIVSEAKDLCTLGFLRTAGDYTGPSLRSG